MAELLIRPALNDHMAVGDVLAPNPSRWGVASPIDRLVVDGHVAAQRPQFARMAAEASVPFLVDPVTPLLQSAVAEEDKWARLPFARAEALELDQLSDAGFLRDLAIEVAEFQLCMGATAVIPAYPYVSSPEDPWFEVALALLRETAEYVDLTRPGIDMLPILCAQLQAFSGHQHWRAGLDRFTSAAHAVGSDTIAVCLSPAGAPNDRYGKIMRLFDSTLHVKESGLNVLAWHQGVYGPALVAAGLDGYETGIGTGERTDVSAQQSRRRPKKSDHSTGGGGGAGIFIETLGRSVPRRVGQELLGHVAMRPKVMCDVESCCPTVAATLDHSRQHAVRTRARLLRKLEGQPHTSWRLTQVSRDARQAMIIAQQASKVLAAAGVRQKIDHHSLEALARVAEELAQGRGGLASTRAVAQR